MSRKLLNLSSFWKRKMFTMFGGIYQKWKFLRTRQKWIYEFKKYSTNFKLEKIDNIDGWCCYF